MTKDSNLNHPNSHEVEGSESGPGKNTCDHKANQQAADNPENELQRLQEEVEKWKRDYLYLKAEFENYRRNAVKERADLLKYGPERFVTEFLNVFDLFESALATKATPENVEAFQKGFELLYQQTKALLNKFGIQDCPSLGEDFDPTIYEALGAEETDEFEPGKISKVLRKPYKFHERLIRPGQVMVAKAPTKN